MERKKSKVGRRIAGILLVAVLVLCLIKMDGFRDLLGHLFSNTNTAEETLDLFAMDTFMSLTAYGEDAEETLQLCKQRIEELDKLLSTGLPESEISQLNQQGTGVLSRDSNYLMKRSMEICEQTGGTFHPLIYPVMELWGFPTQNYQVPDDVTLQETMQLLDTSKLDYDSDTGRITFLEKGMKMDFGGIAKGYTSAEVIRICKENGMKSAIMNLGGNVWALGSKPDGNAWHVAVRDPQNEADYIGILSVRDCAVITSGGYERYFEQDGKRYHHIIDPAKGYPADSGLTSVTIVSEDATLADALSTSLFIMGLEDATEYWKEHSDEFEMILVTADQEVYLSPGIAEQFQTEHRVIVIDDTLKQE